MLNKFKELLKKSKAIVKIHRNYYAHKSGKRHINEAINVINEGINPEAKIFQISYRLERGICLCHGGSEKKCWGYNKANELVDLLKNKSLINNNDSVRIGIAALSAYVKEKEKCTDDEERTLLARLKKKITNSQLSLSYDSSYAGVKELTKDDSWHSIKTFSIQGIVFENSQIYL